MRDNLIGKKGREPVVISLTRKETESRRMSPRRLKQAVEAIRQDGYVVIENAVPHEPLDMLREKMDQDSKVLIDREQWGGAGQLKGHLQQGPPPFAPFVFREIVANPFVIQVNTALLERGDLQQLLQRQHQLSRQRHPATAPGRVSSMAGSRTSPPHR